MSAYSSTCATIRGEILRVFPNSSAVLDLSRTNTDGAPPRKASHGRKLIYCGSLINSILLADRSDLQEMAVASVKLGLLLAIVTRELPLFDQPEGMAELRVALQVDGYLKT